jgi:hypothetical protein
MTSYGLRFMPAVDPARIVAAGRQLGFPLSSELTEWRT